jgi:hypothetical protein
MFLGLLDPNSKLFCTDPEQIRNLPSTSEKINNLDFCCSVLVIDKNMLSNILNVALM